MNQFKFKPILLKKQINGKRLFEDYLNLRGNPQRFYDQLFSKSPLKHSLLWKLLHSRDKFS